MRPSLLALLLLLPVLAAADNTLPPHPAQPLSKSCNSDDSPYFKDRARLSQTGRGDLLSRTEHFGLFASRDRSVVNVFALDGASTSPVLVVDVRAVGLVEGENGTLLGILSRSGQSGQQLSLVTKTGVIWTTPPLVDANINTVTARVSGGLLLVAAFRRNASGASLQAFERRTGNLSWRADVVEPIVDRSELHNHDVTLRAYDLPEDSDLHPFLPLREVEMKSYESTGCYTQTFNFYTGKRKRTTKP